MIAAQPVFARLLVERRTFQFSMRRTARRFVFFVGPFWSAEEDNWAMSVLVMEILALFSGEQVAVSWRNVEAVPPGQCAFLFLPNRMEDLLRWLGRECRACS